MVFLIYVLDTITIEKYGRIAIALSLLMVIMAMSAYIFRKELILFVTGKFEIPYIRV
jgi:hypothetical protein